MTVKRDITNLRMATIGEKLDASRGIGHGFDFVRLMLALGVLAWHSVIVTGSMRESAYASPFWFADYVFVPGFLALSGFLVTASGLRLNVKNFLLNRATRIIPGLAVVVLFSAFILGPLYTTLPLSSYFSDKGFWSYLTSAFGYTKYYLPGVFVDNPYKPVNGALWTLPYEICCYLLAAVLILFGILRYAFVVSAIAFAFISAAIIAYLAGLHGGATGLIRSVYNFVLVGHGAKLFPCFFIGSLFYLLRYKIPHHWGVASAAALLCIGAAVFGSQYWLDWPIAHLVLVPCIVYLVVFVGLSDPPKIPLFANGDYSYGIYLYNVPVGQAVVASYTSIQQYWWLHLTVALPLVIACAVLSWHFVERPMMQLRKRWSPVARTRENPSADVALGITSARR